MNEDETPLDAAFRAMEAAPDDAAARLRFHERVLDAELFVLLETEAEGGRLRPRVFDAPDGRVALAFDRDARLAGFLTAPAPYAALSGRRLAAALAGSGVGVALNPGAASETVLSAEAVDWLAGMASGRAELAAARLREVAPPRGAAPALIAALEIKLAAMADRVAAAWLVLLVFEDGGARLGLGIAGVPEAGEAAVAAAISEVVRFSGLEDGGLDVTFLGAGGRARMAFERVGLRFERPPVPAPETPRGAPGSDPSRPPILR